jgi:hypothetical protein
MTAFDFELVPGLPGLLWVASIERGGTIAGVRHGPGVETRANWFVEGAWDGAFAEGGATVARVLTGTAGTVGECEWVFATPTHTLDRLHLIVEGDRLHLSNSMALLLATVDDGCDPGYRYYMHDFATIMKGIRDHAKSVPTRRGNRILMYYHCNVHVDANLGVRAVPKPELPAFRSYPQYRALLASSVAAVVRNAAAPQRGRIYAPLVGISSGYDSPACAVLAREAGCTEAFTFTQARPRPGIADDDSGTAIGERLGYRVAEFDRNAYLARSDRPEVEFLATGTGGDLVMLSSIEPLLAGRILLTGDHGDTAWDRCSPRVSREIRRGDPGSSLIEFRSRVGFLLLPVPFIGIVHHPELHTLSNGPEMRPWSLGRERYDRPVPRRIAEEQGVPREAFGQAKRAIAQTFHPTTEGHEPLEAMLSPAALQAFRRYYEALPVALVERGRRRAWLLQRVLHLNLRVNRRLQRWARRLGVTIKPVVLVPERYGLDHAPNDFTFHWAIGEVIRRHRSALDPACHEGGARDGPSGPVHSLHPSRLRVSTTPNSG